jgi:RNA polymerase sigma-70 factor (ECF subfamily)
MKVEVASLAHTSDDARIPEIEDIFHECFGLVWSNLRRLGVAPGDLDDATQEVFVVVHRRRDSIDPAQIRPWLYGIVRRIASRYRRGDARRGRLTSAVALVENKQPTLDDDAATREAITMVEEFLAALDDDKREVFVLAELEQWSGKEIATALGIRADTVWSRLRAARESFDRHFTRVRAELRRASGSRGPVEARDALALSRRARQPPAQTRRRVAALLAVKLPQLETIARPVWWGGAIASEVWIVAGSIAIGTTALVGVRSMITVERPAVAAIERENTSVDRTPAIEPAPIVADGLPTVAPAPALARPPAPTPPRPKPAAVAPTVVPPQSSLAAELALLEQARHAEPARALELAETHAREYPNGKLAPDALAIRVSALCELGRDADAARIAALLDRASPWAAGCPAKKTSTKPGEPGDDHH